MDKIVNELINTCENTRFQHSTIPIDSCVPSLRPTRNAVSYADAQALLTCYSRVVCDYQMVTNILTHRSSTQIEQIKKEYLLITGKSLVDISVTKLFGIWEYVALCLLHTGSDADAYILHHATKGLGKFDTILVHILCSRSPKQIERIKESYLKMFKQPLVDHVRSETTVPYQDLLTHLIEKPRSVSNGNPNFAKEQATLIYSRSRNTINAGCHPVPVFANSSFDQIRLISKSFEQQFGQSLVSYLDHYMGTYSLILSSICHFAIDPLHYFARYLKEAIEDMRIHDVIVLMTSRREIDLASILKTYTRTYQSSPEKDIKNAFQKMCEPMIILLEMLMGLR